MIVGVGIDVVDLDRFVQKMTESPSLVERLFTPAEREVALPSLAARFAAKEALAKSLGAPAGLSWLDAEVCHHADGQPFFRTHGTVADRMDDMGIDRFHLSIAHDGPVASAIVIAEG